MAPARTQVMGGGHGSGFAAGAARAAIGFLRERARLPAGTPVEVADVRALGGGSAWVHLRVGAAGYVVGVEHGRRRGTYRLLYVVADPVGPPSARS